MNRRFAWCGCARKEAAAANRSNIFTLKRHLKHRGTENTEESLGILQKDSHLNGECFFGTTNLQVCAILVFILGVLCVSVLTCFIKV